MAIFNLPEQAIQVSAGPTMFVNDGINTNVEIDSADATNNKPMPNGMMVMKDDGKWYPVKLDQNSPYAHTPIPVAITDVLGNANVNVNLSGSTLSVDLQHDGLSPSSVKIGDGTNTVDVVPVTKELKVHDEDVKTLLTAIDGHVDGLEALIGATNTALATIDGRVDGLEALATSGNASLSSIDTKLTSQATGAKQDTGNASLSSIDTKLSSTATSANQTTANASLSSIDGKLTGVATSANQTSTNTKLDTLITDQGTGNTSLSSIDTKLTSQATGAKQDLAKAVLDSINTKLTTLNTNTGAITPLYTGVLTGINASSGALIDLTSSASAVVKKIKVSMDFGETVEVITGGATVIANIGFGGDEIELNLPATTRISVRMKENTAVTGVNFIYHLLG